MTQAEFDAWSAGQSYKHYMGRWSRSIAAKFINWVDPPADADWLEIGCGTEALNQAILSRARPRSILSTDRSADFVARRQRLKDHLAAKLGTTGDVALPARAWAVKASWPAAGS